jgi:metal-sulfur cluster biosynthetic enzyme
MTKDAIFRALEDVTDPEFPASIVDMGLVVDASASCGIVHLKLTFTSMGCPAMDMIMDDIRERLLREQHVEHVDIEVVWDPIWTSQRLTDEGKLALQEMGIAV